MTLVGRWRTAMDLLAHGGPVALPLADVDATGAGRVRDHARARPPVRPARPLSRDYATHGRPGCFAAQGVLAASIAQARGLPLGPCGRRSRRPRCCGVAVPGRGDRGRRLDRAAAPAGRRSRTADGVRFEIETLDAEDWHRFWSRARRRRVAIRSGWPPFQQRFATRNVPAADGLAATPGCTPFRAAWPPPRAATGVSVLPVRANARATRPARRCGVTPLGRAARTDLCPSPAACRWTGWSSWRRRGGCRDRSPGMCCGCSAPTVLRIEPPGGDPMRGVPPMAGDCSARFPALNSGKQAVELDLSPAAGRHAVGTGRRRRRLPAQLGTGQAPSVGLDARHLTTVRPGLVYACGVGLGRRARRPPADSAPTTSCRRTAGWPRRVRPGAAGAVADDADRRARRLWCAPQGVLAGTARPQSGPAWAQRVDSSLLFRRYDWCRMPVHWTLRPRCGTVTCTAHRRADRVCTDLAALGRRSPVRPRARSRRVHAIRCHRGSSLDRWTSNTGLGCATWCPPSARAEWVAPWPLPGPGPVLPVHAHVEAHPEPARR